MLRLIPLHRVVGRVLSDRDSPSLPVEWISGRDSDLPGPTDSLVSAADGRFEVELPAGKYAFHVPPVQAGARVVRAEPVEVTVPGADVTLLARETGSIRGRRAWREEDL